jgi:hypothetical protein
MPTASRVSTQVDGGPDVEEEALPLVDALPRVPKKEAGTPLEVDGNGQGMGR